MKWPRLWVARCVAAVSAFEHSFLLKGDSTAHTDLFLLSSISLLLSTSLASSSVFHESWKAGNLLRAKLLEMGDPCLIDLLPPSVLRRVLLRSVVGGFLPHCLLRFWFLDASRRKRPKDPWPLRGRLADWRLIGLAERKVQ